jgi:Skp family chaperone for outer membrane proteins
MSKNLFLLALSAVLSGGSYAGAADGPAPTNTQRVLTPEQRRARMEALRERDPEGFARLREELRKLPPEERQKRLREEFEKRREELKQLPPAEREAKLKELRQHLLERQRVMSPDERKAKRQEIKARFDKQLAELRSRKTNGTITAVESKRLERLEAIRRRFGQAQEGGVAGSPATP